MEPWTDEHFIRVQDGPPRGTNRVTFRNQSFDESGFLSFSQSGSAEVCISRDTSVLKCLVFAPFPPAETFFAPQLGLHWRYSSRSTLLSSRVKLSYLE